MNKSFVFGILIFVALCFNSSIACANASFYGKWIIKEWIAAGRVAIYDDKDIKTLFLGKEITYMPDEAIFGQNTLRKPYYSRSCLTKEEFAESTDVDLSKLGINSDTVVKVEVYQVHIKEKVKRVMELWDAPVSVFYIKDQDTLIMYSGGVYFKLVRKK